MLTDLNKLYSSSRGGIRQTPSLSEARTAFQRDFDRVIFSAAFRRLQNKTQVFPLPGSVFVHNRLTHSLEVASVGRSLGNLAGGFIATKFNKHLSPESKWFFRHNLQEVIAAACLCHDIGNPAFGHSGEEAIADYFVRNEAHIRHHFTPGQWADFLNFEGNSNAFRILTHRQTGKSDAGMQLTYSTLSAILKYPCESLGRDATKKVIYRKKFGFFQAEKETFLKVAEATGMQLQNESPLAYYRHPFVWLTEAADDICYNIVDLEDAHRLGITDHPTCVELLLSLVKAFGNAETARVKKRLATMHDHNDRVAYLRAKSISYLLQACMQVIKSDIEKLLDGTQPASLTDTVNERLHGPLNQIASYSVKHIYSHRSVLEIENAGFNVMYELLNHFIHPILKEKSKRTKADKLAIALIPEQFLYTESEIYHQVMGILDFVSGMTDNYATEIYRKIKGIEIGMVR